MQTGFKYLRAINYLFLLIVITKMIIYNDYSNDMIKLGIPFCISLLVLRYFKSIDKNSAEEFIRKCFLTIYSIFLIQLVGSLIESLRGSFFVEDYNTAYKSYISNAGLYVSRFILPVPLILNPFNYLHFGLSGFLGQHNQWALQLPFFNLIFLYAFLRHRERRYLSALFIVIVAQLLNTTRTSLVLILLCDLLVFFYLYMKRSSRSRIVVLALLLISTVMASNAVTVLLQTMVAQSDTLTIRFSIYQYAWRYVQTHYQEMLVGYGYRNLGNLVSGFLRSANYNVVLKGFENGFFDTVFVYGLAGFALFVLLIYDGVQSMWTTSYGKLIGVLFILSVISINMTLSYMFPSFVYPFVTLLLVIIPADLHLKEQTITD